MRLSHIFIKEKRVKENVKISKERIFFATEGAKISTNRKSHSGALHARMFLLLNERGMVFKVKALML